MSQKMTYVSTTATTNPYASASWVDPDIVANRLPGFCKTIFIISLILTCLRIPILLLSIVGHSMISQGMVPQQPGMTVDVSQTAAFELSASAFIVIFGLLANSLLLAKNPTGIAMGWMLVMSVVGSMGVAIWQTIHVVGQMDTGTPESAGFVAGMIGGVAVTLIVRLVLLGLYVAALLLFTGWLRTAGAAAGSPSQSPLSPVVDPASPLP
jgi:hypothetical protein